MPTLDFKGKSFVYAHHLSVPFRELVIDAKKSLPAKGQKPSLDDNLIIHGDSLHALKALLPVYAGKVNVVCIDPPYNLGGDWSYNDSVNSPLMREWLKKSANPVEKDGCAEPANYQLLRRNAEELQLLPLEQGRRAPKSRLVDREGC